jgi:hypothetical protein
MSRPFARCQQRSASRPALTAPRYPARRVPGGMASFCPDHPGAAPIPTGRPRLGALWDISWSHPWPSTPHQRKAFCVKRLAGGYVPRLSPHSGNGVGPRQPVIGLFRRRAGPPMMNAEVSGVPQCRVGLVATTGAIDIQSGLRIRRSPEGVDGSADGSPLPQPRTRPDGRRPARSDDRHRRTACLTL